MWHRIIELSSAQDIIFCCAHSSDAIFLISKPIPMLWPFVGSYVVTIRWNRLIETIPTDGHNIWFNWEKRKYRIKCYLYASECSSVSDIYLYSHLSHSRLHRLCPSHRRHKTLIEKLTALLLFFSQDVTNVSWTSFVLY